jgi:hypothetical protein
MPLQTQIIQFDFINSSGHQDLTLTVVGKVGAKRRLRLKIRRNHYDFQSYAKSEVWTKQVGGLDAGWTEVLTMAGETMKYLPTESRDMTGRRLEDARDEFRAFAQTLARDTLALLGYTAEQADEAAEELLWGKDNWVFAV